MSGFIVDSSVLISASDTQLWRGISGEHFAAKNALRQLRSRFNDGSDYIESRPNNGGSSSSSSKDDKVVVCLLDELDYLLTRDFEVMYNFFNWPCLQDSAIVIVGIANTMDLPEKLQNK